MNRKEEYADLLTELEEPPMELEYTLTRVEAKLRSKRRHRLFIVPISSIALFFVVFTIFVNCSITFAYACGRIPLIKDLAQFVAASPSLSAAVKNEYVQPIELEQTKNDITARVEYAIVDQKQLAVFYSLDSTRYGNMDVSPKIKSADGKALEGYSISSGSFDSENRELRQLTVDFVDDNMPNGMQLILNVRDNGSSIEDEMETESMLMEEEEYSEMDSIYELDLSEPLAEFNFELVFDPYFTAKGETINLNQTFEIDGQNLTATTIDIYPTHIRLNFTDDEKNTAWLKALEFHLENEKGTHFEAISNGITATGSVDSPMMQSHRLESPFFSKSKSLTVFITGATWLDKDMEKVRVNLKNKTAECLPENVKFEEAIRKGDHWMLTFSGKRRKEGASYQIWGQSYYDEQGKEYSYNTWSSDIVGYYDEEEEEYINYHDEFGVEFALRNYPFDVVYLKPSYSRRVLLEKPIEIKVK